MTAVRAARRPSVRIGALVVLATCFAVSAMFRAGDVVAQLPATGDDGFGNPVAAPVADGTPAGEAPASARNEVGPTELLEELRRQRAQLAEREARVQEREQTLAALDQKMRDRLVELQAARDRLASTAALVDDAAVKDVQRLAEMYQQMKPKQAGQIFNEMAPSFAAGFIAEMRPDAAALILANMDADKAYAVSLLLAGRNVRPATAQQGTAAAD